MDNDKTNQNKIQKRKSVRFADDTNEEKESQKAIDNETSVSEVFSTPSQALESSIPERIMMEDSQEPLGIESSIVQALAENMEDREDIQQNLVSDGGQKKKRKKVQFAEIDESLEEMEEPAETNAVKACRLPEREDEEIKTRNTPSNLRQSDTPSGWVFNSSKCALTSRSILVDPGQSSNPDRDASVNELNEIKVAPSLPNFQPDLQINADNQESEAPQRIKRFADKKPSSTLVKPISSILQSSYTLQPPVSAQNPFSDIADLSSTLQMKSEVDNGDGESGPKKRDRDYVSMSPGIAIWTGFVSTTCSFDILLWDLKIHYRIYYRLHKYLSMGSKLEWHPFAKFLALK